MTDGPTPGRRKPRRSWEPEWETALPQSTLRDLIEKLDQVLTARGLSHGGAYWGPWPAHEHSDLDGEASWSQLDPDDYYEPVRVTVSLFGNGLIRVNVAGSPQVQIIVHEGISTRTVASAIGELIEALQVA